MLRILVAALLFALGCERDSGEAADYDDWSRYTTADGLAYDTCAGLVVASNGDLWCTHPVEGGGGVSRFDGDAWTHYTVADGLASDALLWFNALAVAPNGDLCAGTFGEGLSVFDGAVWTTLTTADGLLCDTLHAVAFAPNGDLWCAGPGLSRYDGVQWTTYSAAETGLSAHGAIAIAATLDGQVWAGFDELVRFDGMAWTSFSGEPGLEHGPVMSIAGAPDGPPSVARYGASRFDGTSWRSYSLAEIGAAPDDDTAIVSLAFDSLGRLWAASSQQGAFRFDGGAWVGFTSLDGLVGDALLSVAAGADGSVWFGTTAGVSRYAPR